LADVVKILEDNTATALKSEQSGLLVLRVMAFKCGVTAGTCALLVSITPLWVETGHSANEFESGLLYGIQNESLVNTADGYRLTDEGFDRARAEQ
jgi:hypothetical protein